MDFPVADIELPSQLAAPPALVELQELRGDSDLSPDEAAGGVRFRAIRQEGLRMGAQTGLAHRYSMIMEYLNGNEPKLNVTFSFNPFIRDGRLLVPSIQEAQNQFVLDEQTGEASIVRNAYTVLEEARIVSVTPTWRDYLYQEYTYPEAPHRSVLPRTESEARVWEQSLKEGWVAGLSQADSIYDDRLAALTQAVEGRHLYNTLESKNVFTPASLQVVANKVTFNGRTMNVGEVIYSIRGQANFKNAQEWRPVWTR